MDEAMDKYFMKKVKHKEHGAIGLVTSIYEALDHSIHMTVRTQTRLFVSTPITEWELFAGGLH